MLHLVEGAAQHACRRSCEHCQSLHSRVHLENLSGRPMNWLTLLQAEQHHHLLTMQQQATLAAQSIQVQISSAVRQMDGPRTQQKVICFVKYAAIGVSPSESGSQPAGSRQQSSAKQRDPQVGLQKENSPAGSSKALGNKRLPQAADRPSDLRYKYSAARAGKREDVSGAVCNCALGSEVIQQQALLLAEQARSAQASVDKTFAAAESEMQVK